MRRQDREITDSRGIEEILLQCKTCHVAMIDGDTPYLVPLSFGYKLLDGGALELYFHSALVGRKLDALRQNSRACFEVSYEGEAINPDNPCNSGYYYASVIGFGDAVFIEDAAEKCEALSLIVRHQTAKSNAFTAEQAETVCVFKIVSTDFAGKKKPHSAGNRKYPDI